MAHRLQKLRAPAAIAAILLQVHLFLVLQLHHHGLDACRVFEEASISDGLFHARSPEAPLLPCPACHVAEHTLIEHSGPAEATWFMPLAGDVPLPEPPRYAFLRRCGVYGRDPPLS